MFHGSFRVSAIALTLWFAAAAATAQTQPAPAAPATQDEHAGHTMPAAQEPSAQDAHAGHHMSAMGHPMVHFSPRDSSGTAWLPDFSPMYAYHTQWGAWETMLHGNLFLQYLWEGGEEHRTSSQAGSINWVMLMTRRQAGAGRVGVRSMLSLEPVTIGGCGYPVLLATGEICNADSIHDKQHPHDLFMELAVEYDRPIGWGLRWQLYGGLAGEPALGPAGFPHRLSAFTNLLAPIGHHWLDATHITFGLVTTGVYSQRWKVEGSVFNGREPDEDRYDLDLAALDAYAARVWWLPTDRFAFQVSGGHLPEAEQAHPGEPRTGVDRVTASGTYHRPVSASGYWATTLGWGLNVEDHGTTNAFLLESAMTPNDRDNVFLRFEVAQKDGEALHVHDQPLTIFTVGRLQGGYARYFTPRAGLQPGIGATVSLSMVPESLAPRYGGRVTPGAGVFLTLRAARM